MSPGGIQLYCTFPGCRRTYKKPCHLTEHLMSHTNEKPFSCSFLDCDKSYRRNSHLLRHFKLEHPENNVKADNASKNSCSYECHFCGRAFNLSANLTRHLAIHNRSQSIMCFESSCSATFATKLSVLAHMRTSHGIFLPYPCQECGKRFKYPCKLREHTKFAHDLLLKLS